MSAVINRVGVLVRCFVEVVAYVELFKKTCSQRQPPFNDVHGRIMQLLSDSAKKRQELNIDPREYDDARFAVVAWIDETLMNVSWVHRGEWQRNLLQTELYTTHNAGEEFFEHLNRLSGSNNMVREVYYLCLCLGFSGRYCHPGDDVLLEQLRASNVNAILGARGQLENYVKDPLFDTAYESLKGKRQVIPPNVGSFLSNNILLFILPVLLLVGLFFIYDFVLDGIRDSVITELQR